LLQVKLAPGDFVEQIALGQNADQLAVFDYHRLPDADGLDARNGVSHRIGWADQHKPIIRDVADGVFHQVHLQAPGGRRHIEDAQIVDALFTGVYSIQIVVTAVRTDHRASFGNPRRIMNETYGIYGTYGTYRSHKSHKSHS